MPQHTVSYQVLDTKTKTHTSQQTRHNLKERKRREEIHVIRVELRKYLPNQQIRGESTMWRTLVARLRLQTAVTATFPTTPNTPIFLSRVGVDRCCFSCRLFLKILFFFWVSYAEVLVYRGNTSLNFLSRNFLTEGALCGKRSTSSWDWRGWRH